MADDPERPCWNDGEDKEECSEEASKWDGRGHVEEQGKAVRGQRPLVEIQRGLKCKPEWEWDIL